MRLRVNGKQREIEGGATVADLIAELGLRVGTVVVELNGEPVERARFGAVTLGEGDVIEVVRPVQGGAPGQMSLDDAKLYLVADDTLAADTLSAVIDAGVDIVQLRMKEALAADVLREGARFKRACRAGAVPFIVNDRPDIALALGSDGVHLGQEDLPPPSARDIVGSRAIIGLSTHSVDDIDRGISEQAEGLCDYIAVGPVYATPTAPGRPAVGLELIRYAADRVEFPWFAIGGINASNIADVIDAGARRVVVVRAIVEAADPSAAAKELKDVLG